MKDLKRKLQIILFLLLGALIISVPFLFPELLVPDELSENHTSLQCDECHEPWEGPQDSKCIDCHEDQNIHLHNNSVFPDNCQSCHELHTTEYKKIELKCNSCHTESHTEVNFSENDCSECHEETDTFILAYSHQNPDVEKISEKDKHTKGDDCYLCHDSKKFDEYGCLSSDCHGTDKYDEKHEEKAKEWKTTDCFEPGCHSKKNGPGGTINNTTNGDSEETNQDDLMPDEFCLVVIILMAVILLILGYLYTRRAMEQ